MKAPATQPQDKYVLRLPDGMRGWLKAEAEKNNRSMNAEIISRLELTRQFDLDVGYEGQVRHEAGPIADYIDQKLHDQNEIIDGAIRDAVDRLRHELADVLKVLSKKD